MATGQYRKPEPLALPEDPIPFAHRNFSPNQAHLNRIIKKDGIITWEQVPFLDQGTLNSYQRRKFLEGTKQGLVPTGYWFRAIGMFDTANIVKDHESKNLGKYVSLLTTIRGLKLVK